MSGDVRLDICVRSPATAELFGHAVPLHKAEEEALTVKFLPLWNAPSSALGLPSSAATTCPKFVNDIPAP